MSPNKKQSLSRSRSPSPLSQPPTSQGSTLAKFNYVPLGFKFEFKYLPDGRIETNELSIDNFGEHPREGAYVLNHFAEELRDRFLRQFDSGCVIISFTRAASDLCFILRSEVPYNVRLDAPADRDRIGEVDTVNIEAKEARLHRAQSLNTSETIDI